MILIALGIVSIVMGCLAAAPIVQWLREGGELWDVQVLLLVLIPTGGCLIHLALDKGYVLRVVTQASDPVFPFSQAPSPEEIHEFIVLARDRFRYTIEPPSVPRH